MSEVALAAGFGSIRRFNHTFRDLFGRPPRELRRAGAREEERMDAAGIALTLSFAEPYDWPFMLSFLAARAIPGVEAVTGGRYLRTVELDGARGWIEIERHRSRPALRAIVRFPAIRSIPAIVSRIRRVFDLGADIAAIERHLARDRLLAPLVAARPGLRMPGGWDGFELATRAILGQQITVGAARMLAGELVRAHGAPLGAGEAPPGLTHVFPAPACLAGSDLGCLRMPRARIAALRGLAATAAADPRLFASGQGFDEALARLRALPGIGEWTAQYIAMRALREPDAFPAADIGLVRAIEGALGRRPSAAELLARAETWRPWRAYAAAHLWAADIGSPARRKPAPSLDEVSDARAVA
jgi:AraC family transcriptional regulator of adaptative response / DNA-3-methyladenine glycosylase II